MLAPWARSFAARWNLSDPALEELLDTLGAVGRGEIARGDARTVLEGVWSEEDGRPPPSQVPVGPPTFEERYEDLGMIAEGGMGEVRRVWDGVLHRPLAMKVLRPDLMGREDLVERFQEEAQATAQLEHPGIIPIHDVGTTPDGRWYFTMKEIRGRTLLAVIEELHSASVDGWGTTETGWTFQKLVQCFAGVCDAIAYAHSRGVLHRDLKPTNIMVGAFGEVVVMDWGLAKVGARNAPRAVEAERPVTTTRSVDQRWRTRSGAVAGTPNYMPPEQAQADASKVGPWSDVYALGAILYHILSDQPPYDGDELDEVVEQVLAAPPPRPGPSFRSEDGTPALEDGLIGICNRAMARDIADRYMDATTLAEAVRGWLEGARSKERALELVDRADRLEPPMRTRRARAQALRLRASEILAALGPHAAAPDKKSAWALEDRAEALEQQVRDAETRYLNLLLAAIAQVPELTEAQERIERLENITHRRVVRTPDAVGYLSLATEPQARVTICAVHTVGRRRVATATDDPARGPTVRTTPISELPLRPGTWELELRAEGCVPLRYPVRIDPGAHWTGVPPARAESTPIRMLPRADLEPHEAAVAAGWSWIGGDVEAQDSLPEQRVWVDAFALAIQPVTNAEYAAFLDALREAGDAREPHARPRHPFGPLFTPRPEGYALPEGWAPDQPVRYVTFGAATLYAEWLSERTGRPWRLPGEREWEKAARGVDARLFPWGDHLDPSWCCIRASPHGAVPQPATVTEYPEDASPYGVRGLAGNVRDWCVAAPPHPGPAAIARGGWFGGARMSARCALRTDVPGPAHAGVGFRLARSL